jgi:hypothetical protein
VLRLTVAADRYLRSFLASIIAARLHAATAGTTGIPWEAKKYVAYHTLPITKLAKYFIAPPAAILDGLLT